MSINIIKYIKFSFTQRWMQFHRSYISPLDYYTFFETSMHVLPWEKESLKLLRSFPAIFMVIDSSNANFLWNHIKTSLASFHGNNEKEVHTKEWFGNNHKSNDTRYSCVVLQTVKVEINILYPNSQETHCNG